MKKTKLTKIIEKYHLNKLIERACWEIKNNTLHINFNSPNKDLVGFISSPIQLEDADVGVFTTSQLLSLVNITGETLLLSFQKQGTIPTKLIIEDSNFNLSYSLSDTMLIERIGSVNEPPNPITVIDITNDFITCYLRAKKALNEDHRLTIDLGYNDQQEKVACFTLGSESSYSNKIKFNAYCDFENSVYEDIPFNGDILRDIFALNKHADSVRLTLWEEGMLKVEVEEEDIKVKYFLVRLQ
jgi:hypothetical protein